MKVLFVNRFYAPDHSATSQMLTDLAGALAAGGADACVIASRLRYDDPSAALAPLERLDGVQVRRVWSSTFGRGNLLGRAFDYASFYLTASFRCLRVARRGDVVVAMTDPPLISVPIGWVARMRGALVVNWLQDIFPEVAAALGMSLARGTTGAMLRSLRNRSLHRASANVVLGEVMRRRVTALGVAPGKIEVIPNWADGVALQSVDRDANPFRVKWGVADKFVVGYSGNMGRVHEFATIIDAAAALAAQADVAFLFIGDGAQKAIVERLVKERRMRNVVFQPYQPRGELGASLGAADVHLVTLRPELEGLVVPSKFYGIAAVGRPTVFIGDPDGEIGVVVRDAACGLCVRQGDVTGLVSAILALRDDVAMRLRMGRAARSLLESRFDSSIALAKWRALLASMGEGPIAGP